MSGVRESKVFFFKKKKQKTFNYAVAPRFGSRRQGAKVFWFFFSKKNCLLSFYEPAA